MKNILIDTCSLIDMLSEDKNKLLPHLVFWKDNNCIKFITHEIIVKEWNEHKENQRQRFEQSLKTKLKHTHEIVNRIGVPIPQNLILNIDNIDEQIKTIDKLLIEADLITTPNEIKIFCSDRTVAKKKKAPYHNKINSTKDAYIIFSALKYFTDKKEDFLFISSNTDDFGSPQNLESEIHPEIIEDFNQINVQYLCDIGRAIYNLKQELPISLLSDEINNINLSNMDNEVTIDKTKPLLDQIYDYISIRKKEVKFYPIHLFINHYPLRINSNNYYSVFSLNTDNEELVDLFKSIEVLQKVGNCKNNFEIKINNPKFYDGVENYEVKIKEILLSFSNNLIFNISSNKSIERININFFEETNCECPKCSFKKLKFSECFSKLNSYTDSKEDLQESSYLNYRIGNYLFAIEKQKKALIEYQKKSLNIKQFIGLFNLSKLSIFIRHNYFQENAKENLLKELKQIDLEYEGVKLYSKENKKFIKYLMDGDFLYNTKDKIQDKTNQLIDQYYSSLSGGWSSNSDVWILINEFAKLESFLVSNLIMYDKFREFQDIFSTFTEGLFASYGISDIYQSRLEHFDDWLIGCLLEYGDADIINKYYKRYRIKKIAYKQDSLNRNFFFELIENFFNNKYIKDLFDQNCEKNNLRFWEYYNNIFKNILTLVSICDFDYSFINNFSNQLISYLENNNFIYSQNLKYIKIFLYRCGEHINKNMIDRLFDLSINNELYHNDDFYDALLNALEIQKQGINISEKQFQIIKNMTFETCSLCKMTHEDLMIIPIYSIISNKDYKEDITETIQQKLQENFSFDLFYEATLFELIPVDYNLLNRAIESSLGNRNKKGKSFKNIFIGSKDERFMDLNAILNLCFKFDIDTNTIQFQAFKEFGVYYAWLIDMDQFDYENFEPKWVGEYSTRYYYKKIYYNKFVKEKLDSYIKNNVNNSIEQYYLDIYVRKTWNV